MITRERAKNLEEQVQAQAKLLAKQAAALKLAREALEYYDSLSSSLNFNFDKGAEALAAIDEVLGE